MKKIQNFSSFNSKIQLSSNWVQSLFLYINNQLNHTLIFVQKGKNHNAQVFVFYMKSEISKKIKTTDYYVLLTLVVWFFLKKLDKTWLRLNIKS